MSERDEKSAGKNELITALGGLEIEITYRQESDFSGNVPREIEQFRPLFGTKEIVKVGKIRSRFWPRYHVIIDSDELTAEMYCNKPHGFADAIEPESLDKVVDTGQELNLPLWGAWFRHHMDRQEMAGPGWKKLIAAAVDAAIKAEKKVSASPGSSPRSG